MRGLGVLQGPFFSGTRCGAARPDIAAVHAPQIPVDVPVGVQAYLQSFEDTVPRAIAAPGIEPVVHGLPWTETLGEIPPWRARADHPKDAIDDFSAVAARTSRFRRGRQELADYQPLFITQRMSSHQ
jgi:hypothetical protein